MSDKRTTELREKLDELGIVWMDVYRPTIFRTCWQMGDADVYCYFDEDKSTGLFELHISGYDFTPEQAVAVTLGSEREKELEKLVQDVWAAYSERIDKSFHPAWEVDSELARRMAAFGFKEVD